MAETEYVSLAMLKSSLSKVEASKDDLMNQAIEAASRQVDNSTGRRFWLDDAVSARIINPRGKVVSDEDGERLIVADIGSSEGLVVDVGRNPNWTTITAQVELEPDDAFVEGRPVTSLLRINGYWKAAVAGRVRVTAKWGWPAVPKDVVQATLIQAVRLFWRKNTPEGVAGSADWGVVRMSRADPDVENLLQHVTLPGFA